MRYEAIFNDKTIGFDRKIPTLVKIWQIFRNQIRNNKSKPSQNLFEYAQTHTLKLVLHGDWASQSEELKDSLYTVVVECDDYLSKCETLISRRCKKLIEVVRDPWGNSTLCKILNNPDKCSKEEELAYFSSENGYFVAMRLKMLCDSDCEDLALRFANACLRCLRLPESQDFLVATSDQKLYILDIYIALLHKYKRTHDIINELKHLTLNEGLQLVQRFIDKRVEESGVEESRVWKHSLGIAELAAQFFMASAMTKPVEEIDSVLTKLLNAWLVLNDKLDGIEAIPTIIRRIIQTADSASHIYICCQVLNKQFGDKIKSFTIELYIRALTTDMNEMEKQKAHSEQEKVEETSKRLSEQFLSLADLLQEHLGVSRECVLTSFSLNPTRSCMERIENLAIACGKISSTNLNENINNSNKSDLAFNDRMQTSNHLNDSDSGNLSANSSNLNLKDNNLALLGTGRYSSRMSSSDFDSSSCTPTITTTSPTKDRMLDALILIKGDAVTGSKNYDVLSVTNQVFDAKALGLSEQLCDDLAVVLSSPRYQLLSWALDWNELKSACDRYLSNAKGTRNIVKELKYLNIDYNQFNDWPINEGRQEYGGIEKGYEQCADEDNNTTGSVSDYHLTYVQSNDSNYSSSALRGRRRRKTTRKSKIANSYYPRVLVNRQDVDNRMSISSENKPMHNNCNNFHKTTMDPYAKLHKYDTRQNVYKKNKNSLNKKSLSNQQRTVKIQASSSSNATSLVSSSITSTPVTAHIQRIGQPRSQDTTKVSRTSDTDTDNTSSAVSVSLNCTNETQTLPISSTLTTSMNVSSSASNSTSTPTLTSISTSTPPPTSISVSDTLAINTTTVTLADTQKTASSSQNFTVAAANAASTTITTPTVENLISQQMRMLTNILSQPIIEPPLSQSVPIVGVFTDGPLTTTVTQTVTQTQNLFEVVTTDNSMTSDLSPGTEDLRTIGSEDSSCGVVQISVQDSPSQGAPETSNIETEIIEQQLPTSGRQFSDSNTNQLRNVFSADLIVNETLGVIVPVKSIPDVFGNSKILATRSGSNMLVFESFVNQARKPVGVGGGQSNIKSIKYSTIQSIQGISSQTLSGVSAQPPVVLPSGTDTSTLTQQTLSLKSTTNTSTTITSEHSSTAVTDNQTTPPTTDLLLNVNVGSANDVVVPPTNTQQIMKMKEASHQITSPMTTCENGVVAVDSVVTQLDHSSMKVMPMCSDTISSDDVDTKSISDKLQNNSPPLTQNASFSSNFSVQDSPSQGAPSVDEHQSAQKSSDFSSIRTQQTETSNSETEIIEQQLPTSGRQFSDSNTNQSRNVVMANSARYVKCVAPSGTTILVFESFVNQARKPVGVGGGQSNIKPISGTDTSTLTPQTLSLKITTNTITTAATDNQTIPPTNDLLLNVNVGSANDVVVPPTITDYTTKPSSSRLPLSEKNLNIIEDSCSIKKLSIPGLPSLGEKIQNTVVRKVIEMECTTSVDHFTKVTAGEKKTQSNSNGPMLGQSDSNVSRDVIIAEPNKENVHEKVPGELEDTGFITAVTKQIKNPFIQRAVKELLHLQKSLSEKCEDLGVDEPSTSDLFPDLHFNSNDSPSYDQLSQDADPSPTSSDRKRGRATSPPDDDDDDDNDDAVVNTTPLLSPAVGEFAGGRGTRRSTRSRKRPKTLLTAGEKKTQSNSNGPMLGQSDSNVSRDVIIAEPNKENVHEKVPGELEDTGFITAVTKQIKNPFIQRVVKELAQLHQRKQAALENLCQKNVKI